MGRVDRISRALVTKALVALLLIGGLNTQAFASRDQEQVPSATAMVADLVVARPLGVVATVVGSAVFVVSLPFSALGGNVDEAADKLVISPAKETFVRCLGCTRSGRAQRTPSE